MEFSTDRAIIYSVNENHSECDSLSAIAFDKDKLEFEDISEIDIKGSDPCFISIDRNNNYIFCANYSDGTLSCVAIKKDGSLNSTIQLIKHEIDPLDLPHTNTHMHATLLPPCEQFLLASNLGQDTITIYDYTPTEEKPLSETGYVYNFPNGTGPRHFIFDQAARFLYVVGELDASLHVLAWDAGKLIFIQQLMLMPPDFSGKNSAADIHFGADGKYLYVSNRGDANQIISFKIDKLTAHTTFIERILTGGKGPRNFAIDKEGGFMIIAHEYSNDIKLFKINSQDGKISTTGLSYQLPSPVFVCFL